jgi:hypothetical protein
MSNFQIEHFLPGSRCSLRDALHGAGPELAAHTLAADSIHRSMEKELRPKAGAEAGTSLTAPCGGQPSAADLDFFGERPSESDTSQRSATWTLSWGIRRAVLPKHQVSGFQLSISGIARRVGCDRRQSSTAKDIAAAISRGLTLDCSGVKNLMVTATRRRESLQC